MAFKLPTRDPSDPSLQPQEEKELGHEETVAALEAELCSYGCAVGLGGGSFRTGSFGQHWRFRFQVERGELEGGAAKWARRVLFGARLDPARLAVAAASLLAAVPDAKRNAQAVARCARA